MGMNEAFIAEIQQEAQSTRKLLERVPMDKLDWKPHEKSTTLGSLATHVAEIPGWTAATLDFPELDFAKMEYKQNIPTENSGLLRILDENVEKAITSLKNADDKKFFEDWTLKNGDVTYFTLPKAAVVRSFSLNHWYHHRAQLGVYLRLLDVPLPSIYGPTADEQM